MVNRINGEGKPSPCIRQCGLEANVMCRGCFRTVREIIDWRTYDVSNCMDVMAQINRTRGTHQCPACHRPAYCAIEDGKSSNTCWCMGLPTGVTPNTNIGEECLCRQCLTASLTGIKDASRKEGKEGE